MTRAWKFLDERSRGMFSGFAWPVPRPDESVGPWVESGPTDWCRRGIHACRREELSWWLAAQLWEIELAGAQIEDGCKIVAERGRLMRRVPGWPEAGEELAIWAVWRTREITLQVLEMTGRQELAEQLAGATTLETIADLTARDEPGLRRPDDIALRILLDAVEARINPILACVDAGRAAGHAATLRQDESAFNDAFEQERHRQSIWLADRLALVT